MLLPSSVQKWWRKRFWRMDIHTSATIHPTALIDRTWPRGVHIGADCRIAEEAVVLTHDFTRGLYLHTRIGPRTILGARAIIMPGLTIGEDCLVMPGAVVTRDMPAGTLAKGNPATISSRNENLGSDLVEPGLDSAL
jgi:acetyltransferase-like isoleucine patch superfamily enzyme